MASPYMNFILPTVGPLGTQGPDWANEINTALTTIDAHDHSSGKGKQITPAGLNINQTLQMNQNQLSEVTSIALENLNLAPSGSSLIYEQSGELYFKDASGTPVQITSGGAVNVSGVGGITGDYSTTPGAELRFTASSGGYAFLQASAKTGSIDCGPVSIYRNVVGSAKATIEIQNTQSGNLTWALPNVYPASTLPVKSTNAGVLSASQILTAEIGDAQVTEAKLSASVAGNGLTGGAGSALAVNVDNSTLEINSDQVRLKDGGVVVGKLANLKYGAVNLTGSTTAGWTTVGSTVTLSGLTIGRPIFVCVQPGASDSYIRGYKSTGGVANTSIGGYVRVTETIYGGVIVNQNYTHYLSDDGFTTSWGFSSPGFTKVFINSSETSITFQVSILSVNSTTFSLNNMQLFVYEA